MNRTKDNGAGVFFEEDIQVVLDDTQNSERADADESWRMAATIVEFPSSSTQHVATTQYQRAGHRKHTFSLGSNNLSNPFIDMLNHVVDFVKGHHKVEPTQSKMKNSY